MKTAVVEIESINGSPYSQSRHHNTAKLNKELPGQGGLYFVCSNGQAWK
jgi:hypothetical protein